MAHSVFLCILLTAFVTLASAAPIPNFDQFPIQDGFPTPNKQQLDSIFRGAGGTLPGYPIPQVHSDTIKSLQLIATHEMIEVSLYETCLLKIKAGGPGFGMKNFQSSEHRDFVINTFAAFYQQEEIHALIGQGGLQKNGQKTIMPSEYRLNTNTYQDCLRTANVIGDSVLGVSQGVISLAVEAGDGGMTADLDALIAQEGQQCGFLRSEIVLNGRRGSLVPAAMPAYTSSTRELLFALDQQRYIKPGTDHNEIDMPVLLAMDVEGGEDETIQPIDQNLTFVVDLETRTGNNYKPDPGSATASDEELYTTYLSGRNMPFSYPIEQKRVSGSKMTFCAFFPADTRVIENVVMAVMTTRNDSQTVQDVAENAVAGPAVIEMSGGMNTRGVQESPT